MRFRVLAPLRYTAPMVAEEVRASLLLPADLWKRVKMAALEADVSLKDFVRQALEAALTRRRSR